MAEKELNIVIKARNEAEGGFAAAEARARQFNDNVDAAGGSKGGKGGKGGIFDAVNIDLAVKFGLLVKGLQGSMSAIDMLTESWAGNWQQAAEAAKQLPLGIGALPRVLEEKLGKWTGITAEVQKYKELLADSEQALKRQNEQLEASQRLWGTPKGGGLSLEEDQQRRQRLAGLDDEVAREREKRRQGLAEQLAKIEAEAEKSGTTNRARVEALLSTERDIAQSEFAAWLKGHDDAEAKKLAAEDKSAREAAQARIRRAAEFGSETLALESELEQKRLRARGLTRQAELEAIREHYRQQRAELAAAGDEIGAGQRAARRRALEENEQIDLAAVMARRHVLAGPATAPIVGPRFAGLAQTFRAEEAVAKMAQHTEQIHGQVASIVSAAERIVGGIVELAKQRLQGYLVSS